MEEREWVRKPEVMNHKAVIFIFFFSSRRRHTRYISVLEFRRVLFRSFTFLFGCGDEKKARGLFNEALLLKGDKEESARRYRLLTKIVSKYPETTAATEATRILNVAHAQLRSKLSVALDTFRLDTGRYPTTKEGLDILKFSFGEIPRWDGPYTESKEHEIYIIFFNYERDGEGYRLPLKLTWKN